MDDHVRFQPLERLPIESAGSDGRLPILDRSVALIRPHTGEQNALNRRDFHRLLATGLVVALSGCGTLMYPERRGQGRGGRIDWTVAGMDAIGLVLFFVPGVIAFAVDYYNGTLFYPEGSGQAAREGQLRSRPLSRRNPSPEEISEVIAQITGQQIELSDESCLSCPLASTDDFWTAQDRLLAAVERDRLTIRTQSP